jgi:hypothetical protein
MPINVTCSSCNATLRAPDNAVGKQIKCPKCQAIMKVPDAAESPHSPLTADPPLPMATAAPSKGREEAAVPDDDDRPRRRPAMDDDDDDVRLRRRRRWRRTGGDGADSGTSNGVSIGLGIGAIVLGLLAAVFALVPCCGSIVAWPAGGLGVLLGIIGLAVSLMAKQKNVAAMIMTGLGSLISLGAIALATIWWIWYGAVVANTAQNMNKMAEKAHEQAERFQKDALERQKEFDRVQKEQQDKNNKAKESQNPATPAEKQLSQNNLKQIVLAFLNYQDTYKTLPSPKGGQGPTKGRLSWRVAILPYVEQQELYQQFKLDQAWDSAANKKVLETSAMPKLFASPRAKPGEERKTYYQTFTGPFTIFPTEKSQIKRGDFQRGDSELWLVAEAANPVDWTRPDDITAPNMSTRLGGIFDGDFNVACFDGKAHYVRKSAFNSSDLLTFVNPQQPAAVAGWPPPR